MSAIGIMGGTFNPIHLGHIEIAKAAYSQFPLDEIWFMPNHSPGYKSDREVISAEDRLAMVELAIQDYSYFRSSDFELKREGPTYSAETFSLLHQQYPGDTFYFIIGADSLYYFEKWKNPETIVQYATMLVAPRDEKNAVRISIKMNELNQKYQRSAFLPLNCKEIPCSSTKIREQLGNSKYNAAYTDANIVKELYLPVPVYQYIRKHNLYQMKEDH